MRMGTHSRPHGAASGRSGSIVVVALLYKYIQYRKVPKQWGDGMRGMRSQVARQMLLSLERLNSTTHVKNWRPRGAGGWQVSPASRGSLPGTNTLTCCCVLP